MRKRQSTTRWLGLALACGTLTFTTATQAAKPPKPPPTPTGPTYKIVSLGTLGGNSVANVINESGWVAGVSDGGAFVVVPEASADGPVYFRDTSPADGINDLMIRLPGLDPSRFAEANGINDAGVIVGRSFPPEGATNDSQSTLWLDGLPVSLADATGLSSSAADISNPGVVATQDSEGNAYVIVPEDTNADGIADNWVRDDNGDGVNDLRLLAAPLYYAYNDPDWHIYFEAQAINDGGQIVFFANGGIGYYVLTPDYTDADGDGNPWYADVNADGFNDLMVRLQSADEANDINASGQVVGMAGGRAVRWDFSGGTQTITDLGTIDGPVKRLRATHINDAGQITGWAAMKNGSYAAFVVYKGTMYSLANCLTNGSGWANLRAGDLNEQGYIVGYGELGGVARAFVIVPVTQP